MGSTFDSIKNRSLEEWVYGSAISGSALYTVRSQWRRGLRIGGAAGKGSGRVAHAFYKSLGDFYRAYKIGNQPFVVEPHIIPALATSLFVATPPLMLVAAKKYPSIAGPAQSTAATGQVSIGSRAGQRLISGKW